jgi:O-antigen ligase
MSYSRSSHVPSCTRMEYVFGAILLCYPALLFLVRGGMNASLFLLTIISLYLLISLKAWRNRSDKADIYFSIAMSSGLMAILISQIYHHDLIARYFDSDSRFLLAIPVLLALRHISIRTLSLVQYAFPLGAIAAFAAVMMKNPHVSTYASTSFMNHIHLGDLALLLGFLSLFSVNWIRKDHPVVKLLKILGLIAGSYVSVVSSARGGWIAIPVFVFVYIYFGFSGKLFNKVLMAMLSIGLVALLAYIFIEPIHHRLWMIYSDLSSFSSGHENTSIGVRLQLWNAAIHLIAQNPVFGVGAAGFANAMDGLSATGMITPIAAGLGKGEVHNEILAHTVRFGIFGLASILAVYFVPFAIFLRAARSRIHQQNIAAIMGMSVTLGFFVFGLTVETFDLKMTAAFYSMTVAILLATATHNKQAPEANGRNEGLQRIRT